MRPLLPSLAAVLAATAVTLPSAPTQAAGVTARNSYAAFTGPAGWARGSADGTHVNAAGNLALGEATGRVSVAGRSYETATWTSAWVSPEHGFSELIGSWNAWTPAGTYVGVSLQVRSTSGRTSSWDGVARWSSRDADFRRTSLSAQRDDLARLATDTLVSNGATLGSWRVKVTLNRQPGGTSPTVRRLGAVASRLPGTLPSSSPGDTVGRTLAVPRYSQMVHRGHSPQYGNGGEAWCSPTSLAMLLGYYDALPSDVAWVGARHADPWVDQTARATYDYAYRGTGNWPFNTAYAGQADGDRLRAFVTRLKDLRQAERFVAAGIPLAASIAFGRGQLDGAPISASNGHLLVIVGFTRSGDVVVNDPAAGSDATVRRTYDRGQLERAWQRRSHGLVYVVHDAAHPLPARGTARAW